MNNTKYSEVLQCIIRCCNVLSCKIVSTYRRLHTHLKRYKKLYQKHGVLRVKMTFCIIERYKLQKVLHCIKLLRNCILTNCINMMQAPQRAGLEPKIVSKTASLRVKWCFVRLNDTNFEEWCIVAIGVALYYTVKLYQLIVHATLAWKDTRKCIKNMVFCG